VLPRSPSLIRRTVKPAGVVPRGDGQTGNRQQRRRQDERRAYLTEVYRNSLARDRRGPKGKDLGFEIKGVPDELLEKYSQRSERRDKAIAEFIKANNRQPTDNEVAIPVRESRADKLVQISTSEVRDSSPEQRKAVESILESRDLGVNLRGGRERPTWPNQHERSPVMQIFIGVQEMQARFAICLGLTILQDMAIKLLHEVFGPN